MCNYPLQTSLDLDFGSSLMDDIMKALNETDDKPSSSKKSPDEDEKNLLLDKEVPVSNGQSMFDNVAMTTSQDSKRVVDDVDINSSMSSHSSASTTKSTSESPKERSWKPKLRLVSIEIMNYKL